MSSYQPCIRLQSFVEAFIIQELWESTTYKVLPGTGLVMGFQFRGKLAELNGGETRDLSISGISGLADHYKIFQTTPAIGTVLVIFKPGGAAPFFKQPLHELFRKSLSLDNFMLRSELLVLEDKLFEAENNFARIALVENFLMVRMKNSLEDKQVNACLAMIHLDKGNSRICEIAIKLNISQSTLERKFRSSVGASPKKFASIVRFKNILSRSNPDISLTQLSYDSGFFDQAHFIKEFKIYTGDTPEIFLKKKS